MVGVEGRAETEDAPGGTPRCAFASLLSSFYWDVNNDTRRREMLIWEGDAYVPASCGLPWLAPTLVSAHWDSTSNT